MSSTRRERSKKPGRAIARAVAAALALLLPQSPSAWAAPDCTAVSNAVNNCSFETGDFTSWTPTTSISPFCTSQAVYSAPYTCGFSFFSTDPIAGSFSSVNGFDGAGPGTFHLSQDVTLPSEASLYFGYRAAWNMLDYGGSSLPRIFRVHVEPSGGGTPLTTFQVLQADPATKNLDTGTLSGHLNLSGFGGAQRVHFEWDIPQNFTGPAQFELDNITVADNCPADANPGQEDTDGDGEGDACDCGDTIVVGAETCDDGNTTPLDGCDENCQVEPPHLVGYKIRLPRKDVGGNAIDNQLPKPWVITVNDIFISDSDADDPENFEVKKANGLMIPAQKNVEPAPDLEGLHYLRYQMKSGKESVAPDVGGDFLRPPKHIKRVWLLDNQFGTIAVESKKVSALLLPANKDLGASPPPPPDASHFVCYQVKATKDVTEQTPETKPGSGKGRFRKDLQAYFEDQLDDCALDKDGNPSFLGQPVEGKCLFDLKRVTELCNPMDKTAVVPPRETAASITPSTAALMRSLLCYQPKLATKFTNATAAGLAGAVVGDKLAGRQAKHTKRGVKTGDPIHTTPGNLFPKPVLVDSIKQDRVCIPTDVLFFVPAP